MNAIVYVNTPLEAPEHAALAALARREGRAKGQQLRLLAIQAMRRNPMPAGSDSYAAHVNVQVRKQKSAPSSCSSSSSNAEVPHSVVKADAAAGCDCSRTSTRTSATTNGNAMRKGGRV